MPDHGDDLVVDELLRNLRRLTRITRIVLGVEHQLDLLAAHHEALLVDFLDRKLGAKISVDDVAAAAGLSASRLAHLFRAETGQTPQRHLEAARMQRAIELLERTGFPVQQIAGAVGFDSPFYFSQRFKRWTGLSPSAYRDRLGLSVR